MLSLQLSSATFKAPLSPSVRRRTFLRKPEAPTSALPNVLKDRSTNLNPEGRMGGKRQKPNSSTALRIQQEGLPDFLLDEDNPFLECHESYSPEAVLEAKRLEDEREQVAAMGRMKCGNSTVSALSEGSFKQLPAAAGSVSSELQAPCFVPPKYICIKVQNQGPDGLFEEDDDDDVYLDISQKIAMDDDTSRSQLQCRQDPLPRSHPPFPQSRAQQPYPYSAPSAPPTPSLKHHVIPQDHRHQHQQQHQPHLSPVWNRPSLSPAPARPVWTGGGPHSSSPMRRHSSPYGCSRAPTPMLVSPIESSTSGSRQQLVTRTNRSIPPPPLTPQPPPSVTRKHKREASTGSFLDIPSLRRTSPVVQELRSFWSKVRNGNHNANGSEVIPDLTMTDSSSSRGCLT